MKLKNQVCTLEQGKRLKELGLTAESYFVHAREYPHNLCIIPMVAFCSHRRNYTQDYIPAYTSAELGELLPAFVNGDEEYWVNRGEVRGRKIGFWNGYDCEYEGSRYEAHAKAAILIVLLEKNIIELKDLKL